MIEKIVTKIISETLETEKYILLAQYHNKDNEMEFVQMNLKYILWSAFWTGVFLRILGEQRRKRGRSASYEIHRINIGQVEWPAVERN